MAPQEKGYFLECDYSKIPIIVLGAGHSGTRLLVDILSELGSNGGVDNNEWRENELFREIHYQVITNISGKSWDKTIFDLKFLKLIDGSSCVSEINKYLAYISQYYEPFDKPWHWKMPASAMLLKSWSKIYPNAYFVHIIRNKFDVAKSLLRRKQYWNPLNAIRFVKLMNQMILEETESLKNYYFIEYERIENQIDDLIDFLPLKVDLKSKKKALNLISRKSHFSWNQSYSNKKNIWELYCAIIICSLKLLCSNKKQF